MLRDSKSTAPNKVPKKRESAIATFLKKFSRHCFNASKEARDSIATFLKKFTGLTPYTIEVAAVISFVLGKYIDSTIMVSLLFVNAVIGVIHEYRAGKAIEMLKMLKSKLKVTVKALRDDRWVDVAAEHIVKLSMGDIASADGVILEGSITIDESALTGESIPVEKSVNDNVSIGSPRSNVNIATKYTMLNVLTILFMVQTTIFL